ncbi:MAG TPA: HEAT repeat domain-containing protein [Labilithrix sp.]
MRARILGSLLTIACLAFSHGASADPERVKFLADKLKSDESRVRVSAALALGASDEDSAVDPLCGALSDGSDSVRSAAALSLKRLGRGSALPCLKSRADRESDDGVKTEIARAIEALNASSGSNVGGDEKVRENPKAKYYIAISSIANSTGRAQTDIERIVAKSMRAKLESGPDIQLAPSRESADDAKSKMSKRKLKGFYLAVAVEQFDYSGGNLRVKVKIGVFTYPGKSLLGNVDKTLTKEGVSKGDRSSEDQMLDLAASLASEQFAQNAQAFL